MKIAIVEDELPAVEKLTRYLQKYDANIEIIISLRSVADASAWLIENQSSVDLIFMDVQLTDGLSFEIFNLVAATGTPIKCPVIFATAYDEFAIDAFQVNGIAYLLKPITFVSLSTAMKKIDVLKNQLMGLDQVNAVAEQLNSPQELAKNSYHKKEKDRFMVKVGDHIQSLKTEETAVFYAEGRTVYLVTKEGKRYIIEYKLEALVELLPPTSFYRVNRTYIVNIEAITDVVVYSNSRLKIAIHNLATHEIVVSREKVSAFKAWFEGEK